MDFRTTWTRRRRWTDAGSSPKTFAVSLALNLYLDPNSFSNYGGLFAMSVVSLIPVVLIFLFFQRHLVEGRSDKRLKGLTSGIDTGESAIERRHSMSRMDGSTIYVEPENVTAPVRHALRMLYRDHRSAFGEEAAVARELPADGRTAVLIRYAEGGDCPDGVVTVQDEVTALVREGEQLVSISTASGTELPCEAVFVAAPFKAASNLAASLCEVDEAGFVSRSPMLMGRRADLAFGQLEMPPILSAISPCSCRLR